MKPKPYDAHPSAPILMRCEDFSGRDFILVSSVIGSPKVAAHKAALGRQAYCFDGERRLWVWESFHGSKLFWRAWVSNAGGIAFEVAPDASSLDARAAWESYKAMMGVTEAKLAAKRAEYGVTS